MKVLFVHDHPFVYLNDKVYSTGGLPSSVWDNYLLDENIQIFVYARNLQDRTAKSITSRSKVNFVLSKYYKSPKDFFINRIKLINEINIVTQNIDVAIIRLPSFLGLIAIDECKKKNIPYLIEVVGNVYDSMSNYGNILGSFFANYIHKLNKNEIHKAKFALYVTQFYLQECYPCKNQTEFASDVEIEAGNIENLNRRLQKIENFHKDNKIIVGTIGNLEVKYKGYDVLLRSISLLKKEGLIVTYRIAGPGNNHEILKLAKILDIENQIEFTGSLNRNQIFSYLNELDLYIHPSYQEGLPRVVVEAMSKALPILASTIGGIPELIHSKYLHTPGDYNKLFLDLKKVLNDKDLLLSMAKENWNKACEYDKEVLITKRKNFISKFYNDSI